jgi:hypothetical protein
MGVEREDAEKVGRVDQLVEHSIVQGGEELLLNIRQREPLGLLGDRMESEHWRVEGILKIEKYLNKLLRFPNFNLLNLWSIIKIGNIGVALKTPGKYL